ncbi:hypothetical protein FQZ97_1049560 [compost metagenome]
MQFQEFRWYAEHTTLHSNDEARVGITIFKTNGQRTTARDSGIADQQHIEQKLDLVLWQQDA